MSNNIEQSFGEILKNHRESQNISITECAGLCGIDRTTVAKIEKGKIMPTVRILFKISKGLQLRPSELIKQLEDAKPSLD